MQPKNNILSLRRKEFGIMKKRLVKGILAAALAFVTVLGVPVSAAQNVRSDSTIIAYAKCNHNYRHYAAGHGSWHTVSIYYKWENGRKIWYAKQERPMYSTCANCGYYDGNPVGTETREICIQ